MTVFIIAQKNGGAHEPDGVFSLWTDVRKAELEIARLTELHKPRDGYRFYAFEIEADKSSDWPLV